jgi:predicted CopG family antitoxin
MTKISNGQPSVSNEIVERVVNITAQEATQKVFSSVVHLDKITQITDDINALLTTELKNASFMTVDLELSEAQKTKLLEVVTRVGVQARDKYIANIKKDERTKAMVAVVETQFKSVINEALSAIGQEVNRGTIISAVAVAANAKKDDYNSIELNYPKDCSDITIPTKGVFVSTNCVALIQESCKVDLKTKEKVDAETGEVLADAQG